MDCGDGIWIDSEDGGRVLGGVVDVWGDVASIFVMLLCVLRGDETPVCAVGDSVF